MMNEETKASLNKFLKEREERIKNMTLAEARDTVSRIYGHSDMRMESDKALQILLDCADKALEQPRWIPVSERLPEVGEKVLCQCQANIYEVLKLTGDGWYHDKNHCYMLGFVIVWMPLPEPYKKGEK